jgi:uroporphyrin-III C-methyltransferase
MKGKVYLVGAGPGDPELLTLKALKTLKSADVVLHDELVSAEILALIRSSASVISVGKRGGRPSISQQEINRLLVEYGLRGLNVVRFKGGDPFIFGRGGEELEAVRQAGIECEIVPGITAALGAAASFQVPLTHRDAASSLLLITGHRAHEIGMQLSQADLANTTVVIYMPGQDYSRIQKELISAGITSGTPCAVVSQATTPYEQTHQTTVGELHRSPELPAPTLLVIGDVVRFAKPANFSYALGMPLYEPADIREGAL